MIQRVYQCSKKKKNSDILKLNLQLTDICETEALITDFQKIMFHIFV